MICNRCKKDKFREKSGVRNSFGRNIYADAEGKAWNGRTCPPCKNLNWKDGHSSTGARLYREAVIHNRTHVEPDLVEDYSVSSPGYLGQGCRWVGRTRLYG